MGDLIRVALMYDFDNTLSPDYMQEYSLLPSLNCDNGDFWKFCNEIATKHNMDGILAYMYAILDVSKKKNVPVSYDELKKQGEKITFFEGVESWFDRINAFGRKIGLDIEHYIISSGLKEIVEGTKIYPKFKRCFACSFAYDENNNAFWPSQAVNYTTKTQYIFRIKKNKLDNLHDQKEVNEVMDPELKLPYKQMIYFGDGETDIPCMKVIKDKGGHSICVYNPASEKYKKEAERLYNDKRVNFIAKADYRDGARLDRIVKHILTKIAIDRELDSFKD